jgi:uncharacterized membrane protein YbhN (UPF0104 family)
MTTATDRAGRFARLDRRRLAWLCAGLLVLGFLVAGLLSGWQRVSSYDWDLRADWLVLGVALLAVFYLASGAGYVAIVERLIATRPRRHHSLSVWARSLLGRYVPGNVLMVIGRVALGKDVGIPRRVSLAASVYEQAFGLGAAAVGSLVFLAFESDLGKGKALWLLALIPLALVLLHPKLFRAISSWALRKAGREPLTRFLREREMVGLLLWYGFTAALLALAVWALVRSAAGPQAGDAAFVGLGFLLSFTVSMVAFVLPSGLGVRDGIFALVLTQHLPGSVALTVAVGLRVVMTLVELGFVSVCAAVGRRGRGG